MAADSVQRLGDGVRGAPADLLGTPGGSRRATIHQACGMVAGQLGVTTGQALARLRGHAYSHELSLGAVCCEVLARRLYLDPH